MIIAFIIILLFLQLLFLLSYITFNDLSLRSLIIPETDDVEESARNAKEVNKILSVIRTILIVFIIIKTSFLKYSTISKIDKIIRKIPFPINVSVIWNTPYPKRETDAISLIIFGIIYNANLQFKNIYMKLNKKILYLPAIKLLKWKGLINHLKEREEISMVSWIECQLLMDVEF